MARGKIVVSSQDTKEKLFFTAKHVKKIPKTVVNDRPSKKICTI